MFIVNPVPCHERSLDLGHVNHKSIGAKYSLIVYGGGGQDLLTFVLLKHGVIMVTKLTKFCISFFTLCT